VIFNIIIAALGTALLVWAAIVDTRTRKIPVAAGFGMLGLGLAVLVKEGWYIWAAYYILAIWCTRGGVWQAVLVVASIGILWAFEWEAAPLVLGITFVSLLFWRNWFGGGDSQLAFGLIGIGHDWLVLALLFGLTIVLGVGLTEGFGKGYNGWRLSPGDWEKVRIVRLFEHPGELWRQLQG
jgi:hypothetical protein